MLEWLLMLLLVNKKKQILDKNQKGLVNKNKKGFDVETAYSESKRSTNNYKCLIN